MNLNDKSFDVARKRGYLVNANEREFKYTFVGAWLSKHPDRVSLLDTLKDIVGGVPTWEDITDRNMKELKEALEKRMCANSVRSYFLRLKAILNDNKMEVSIPSTRYSAILKKKEEPSQGTYLTEKEIEAFENVQTYTENEAYTKAVFLISCYTGCRHSDAMNIEAENIHNGVLSYVSQKTRIESQLPAHKNIYKYLGKFPTDYAIGDNVLNDNIRSLAERAGINERIKVFKAGKAIIAPKYELLSSHSARRSFCTNLFMRGVDILTISRLAGHSSTQMTQRYIVAQKGLSENAMAFFN